MIGNTLFGGGVFGGGIAPLEVSTTARVIFNGYSLDSDNIRIVDANFDDVGQIDLRTYDSPYSDGGGVLSHLYHSKDISFKLSLKADTVEELNNLIDELKKNTAVTEGLLEIKINGEYRTCTASIRNLKFNRNYYHTTFLNGVDISFHTKDPHWTKKGGISILDNVNILDYFGSISYDGTVETQPVFYLIFNTGNTGITGFELTLSNILSITETIEDGDILILDFEKKNVKLNGVEIDYLGVFNNLVVGTNVYELKFNTGATVNYELSILYPVKYK